MQYALRCAWSCKVNDASNLDSFPFQELSEKFQIFLKKGERLKETRASKFDCKLPWCMVPKMPWAQIIQQNGLWTDCKTNLNFFLYNSFGHPSTRSTNFINHPKRESGRVSEFVLVGTQIPFRIDYISISLSTAVCKMVLICVFQTVKHWLINKWFVQEKSQNGKEKDEKMSLKME